jgi:hypothetical protein
MLSLASAKSTTHLHQTDTARSASLAQPGTGAAKNAAIALVPRVRIPGVSDSRRSNQPTTPTLVMRIILRSAKCGTTGFAIFAGCVAGVTIERTHPQRFYQQARGDRS